MVEVAAATVVAAEAVVAVAVAVAATVVAAVAVVAVAVAAAVMVVATVAAVVVAAVAAAVMVVEAAVVTAAIGGSGHSGSDHASGHIPATQPPPGDATAPTPNRVMIMAYIAPAKSVTTMAFIRPGQAGDDHGAHRAGEVRRRPRRPSCRRSR